MKPSEMLTKITTLLQAKVQLEEMKLENGTIIEAESFAEGESVFIVTEDEKVPLPIGDYKLEDGKTLIIEDDGIIGSIGEPKAEEDAEMNEELSEDVALEQVATGDNKVVAEEPKKAKKSKAKEDSEKTEELSEEAPQDVDLEHKEGHDEEMNKIVDAVVQAVSPLIEEMKEELGYVKDELGKMKGEDLAKQEIEEQVREELSNTPAAKAIKHNPEAKPDVKMNKISQNRPTTTSERVMNRLFNKN
jgi:hypothetical protein